MKRFVLVAFVLGACSAKHVSHELAQAACEHQIELGYWKGFDESLAKAGHDSKDPDLHKMGETALVQQKKGDDWKKALDECTKGFEEQGTTAQAECVKGAATTDAAMACVN